MKPHMLWWMLAALTCGLLATTAACGQQTDGAAPRPGPMHGSPPGPSPETQPSPEDRAEMAEIIDQLRAVQVSEELGLDEEQTVLLVRRMKQDREVMRTLHREREEAMRALRESIRKNAPEADIQVKLDALMAKEQALHQARLDSFNRMAGDFNTAQRAKLYLALQDFEGRLRQMIQRARMQGPQPGLRGRRAPESEGQGMEGPGPRPGQWGPPSDRNGFPGPNQGALREQRRGFDAAPPPGPSPDSQPLPAR